MGANTGKGIFIGGVGRSGTSILGDIFSKHPALYYVGEARLASPFARGIPALLAGKVSEKSFCDWVLGGCRKNILSSCATYYPDLDFTSAYSLKNIEPLLECLFSKTITHQAAGEFLNKLFLLGAKVAGRTMWVEKTPHSVVCLDVLSKMFSQLRFIHIHRDPRDVACSLLEQNWGPDSVEEFIPYWHSIMGTAFDLAGRVDRSNYFTLSLERLCANPFEVLERLCDFCKIDFNETIFTQISRNLDVDMANLGRWRTQMNTKDAKLIEKECFGLYSTWLEIENSYFEQVSV